MYPYLLGPASKKKKKRYALITHTHTHTKRTANETQNWLLLQGAGISDLSSFIMDLALPDKRKIKCINQRAKIQERLH